MHDFNGKVALITGEAGGIGLGMARASAQEGAQIVLADLYEAEADKSAGALRQSGARAMTLGVRAGLLWCSLFA